jgi:hypothetical protein
LTDINAAIKILSNNQTEIIKEHTAPEPAAAAAAANSGSNMVSLGTIPKRNRVSELSGEQLSFSQPIFTYPAAPSPRPAPVPVPEPAENVRPEVKKFRDAVKKAESSTLIFNLNLGRVPIMTTGDMSNRATLALAAMAAEKENRPGSIPSEDVLATIDDILSIAKNIDFYGKKTKSYINSKDPKSGSYCTLPVRYEFEDKESRFEAEKYLRQKCDVHCSTPYPAILRECIKQVTDKVKADFPDNHVKVAVDTNKFCLKVARRPATGENSKGKWLYYDRYIPLPDLVLDVDARKAPDGFKVRYLPPGADMSASPIKVNEEAMEVALPGSPGSEF